MDFTASTITLFNFAVDCFDHIQLARVFEEDFALHLIKLDITQIRLTRWGEVTGISKQTATTAPEDGSTNLLDAQVNQILQDIRDWVETAQHRAKKFNPKKNDAESEILNPKDEIAPPMRRLRTKLRSWVERRRTQAALVGRSIQWAFYTKASFEAFLENLSGAIDALEKLIPEDSRNQLEDLSKQECSDIGRANLQTLKEIVEKYDPWLDIAVEEGLEKGYGGTINIKQSRNVGQTTGVHHGDLTFNGVSNGDGNTTRNYWART